MANAQILQSFYARDINRAVALSEYIHRDAVNVVSDYCYLALGAKPKYKSKQRLANWVIVWDIPCPRMWWTI